MASLIGKTMTMTVSLVSDPAGNIIASPYTWSFVMQNFNAANTSVQVSGLEINTPFISDYSTLTSTYATSIQSTIATALNVPASRLQNIVLSKALNGNTLVSVTIVPVPSNTRRSIDYTPLQLAAMLQEFADKPSDTNSQILPSSV